MTTTSIGLLALFVGAFTLLGGVLAWASWDEARRARSSKTP